MTALTTPAVRPSATVKQAGAAVALAFMGFLFFSIAIAAIAVQRLALPASAAADVARLLDMAPFAFAIGLAHVAVAILAVSADARLRAVAVVASAGTAVAFGAGAVAVAAGWDIFQKTGSTQRFAVEGVTIFGIAALIYVAVAALIARSRPS